MKEHKEHPPGRTRRQREREISAEKKPNALRKRDERKGTPRDETSLGIIKVWYALVAACAEETEQEEEEVDEVEIEVQCADCSQFVGHRRLKIHRCVLLNLLSIPRCQACEDDYACK